ncbi:MAG TPA: MFS transporter [Actinopolymorphaceae bacterium]
MPLPLYLLAVAVFAMGTSEFMLAGLAPLIASALDVTIGTAGMLTSAFAIGMIVGAVTTSFPILFTSRVVAALANAGFLAVALTTAAALVSPRDKGRALAVLLSGTTVAMIAGVPGGSLLGTLLGWRATFWAVAALCLPVALGIVKGIPAGCVEEEVAGRPALHAELSQLVRPRLILTLLLGALVNAATFAGFTFLAPVVTDTTGSGELWVAVVLVLFGVGSFTGVTVAGRLSDRRPGMVMAAGGPLLLIGWPALAVLARQPVALFVLVFLLGALSFALGSTLITRVLYEAAGAPTMAGSYATAALNVGAAVGPLVGATALGTGAGDLGPLWASGILVAVALLLAAPFHAVTSRPSALDSVPRR